jgi:WD40 repeat protein
MSPVSSTHPDLEVLAAFARGAVSPEAQAAIARHVAGCAACCEALRGVPDDTLLQRLRLGHAAPTVPPTDPSAGAGRPDIPGYEVLGELGRGGMGVVYRARQTGLNRPVALKMVLAGTHAGAAERARFRAEAEAVARLQHPNIVQIYETGEADGHPFFSLEFCPGGSLAARLAGTPLPPAEAARLVEVLARAVQAAHERGIVHRDLKPANVLLLDDGTPKLTDFGLAKQLGSGAGQTASGAIVGTPSYMAPEQAGGKSKEVGPAADVYALGAILYECLTGRPPFKAETGAETLLLVLAEEPLPPTRLLPKVPRDLETICLKCLQKEQNQRYATAAALAEDLRRFRAGEAIAARPVGVLERGGKWVRRNPLVAALVAAVAAALLLGAGVAALFAVKAEARARGEKQAREAADTEREAAVQAQREALAARDRAEWLAYTGQIALAQREWQDNEVGHARALLDACPEALRGWEHAYLRHLCASNQHTFWGHTDKVECVCWSPDGKRLASAGWDGTVKVWEAETGREACSLKGHTGYVLSVCWSPDGRRLASADFDQTVKVWDAAGGQEVLSLKGGGTCVCWNPDGRRLASAGWDGKNGEVMVWDVAKGRDALSFRGHTGAVSSVCWSPDGRRLASASLGAIGKAGEVKVWDAEKGQEAVTLQGHIGLFLSVCWSPDGKRLASAAQDGTVKVWDAEKGQEALSFRGHAGHVRSVCWSPDGRRLASAGWDKAVKVWDAVTGQEAFSFRGHTREISSVCWSPDGKRLASASSDQAVKVWGAERGQEALALEGHTGIVTSVSWSPDGKRLASAGQDGTVKVWEAVTGRQALSLKGHNDSVWCVCWSPDGRHLASAGRDGTVMVWDAVRGRRASFKGHTGAVMSVCWSPDGRRLASARGVWDRHQRWASGVVTVWDAETGQEAHTFQGHAAQVRSVCWSPDGRRLASASEDGAVKVWDAESGREALSLKGHTQPVSSVCWSPDGRRLASADGEGGKSGEVKVWDAETGQAVLSLKGHTDQVHGVCWSPDGRRLASAGADGTLRVWDAERGQEALILKGHTGYVRSVCWSPDGQRLASAGFDQTVKVWEATPVHDEPQPGRAGRGR